MAGFETYVQAADTPSVTMPGTFPDCAITATNDPTTAIVWAHSHDAFSLYVMAVDYSDPTNVTYGPVVSLLLSDPASKYTIVPVPGANTFIISGAASAGSAGHNYYSVMAFDPATLLLTVITDWSTIDTTGRLSENGFDGFLWPVSADEFITTAFSTVALTTSALVKLHFDGSTLTVTGINTVDAAPGLRGLYEAVVQGSVVYAIANPLVGGDRSLWRIDGAALTAAPILTQIDVDNHIWRVDATTARTHVIDPTSSTHPLIGFRDIDLTTGGIGSPVLYSEPGISTNVQPAVSGDGTLTFWCANTGGSTLANGDPHPRDPLVGGISTHFGPVQALPLDGPHVLGIWVRFFGDPRIFVGQLSERPARRFTSIFSTSGIYEVNAGSPTDASTFYDYATGITGDRAPSIEYWRPVVTWTIDWGDGTVTTGAGPFPEPNHAFPNFVGTHPHVYNRPGVYSARLHVVDAVAATSPADEASVLFYVDQRPPQRQYPRDDGLGISTHRSWPPPTSKQYSQRRGPTATYQ